VEEHEAHGLDGVCSYFLDLVVGRSRLRVTW
jgi:hypothetical protein